MTVWDWVAGALRGGAEAVAAVEFMETPCYEELEV